MQFNQFRNHRFLNISALLASGEFIIDDNGYLVAIGNGTRYRLPSGPPEGRASESYELQPILPGKNQQLADSAVDWLDLTTPATAIATTHNNNPLYTSSPASNFTISDSQGSPEMLSLYLGLAACSVAILVNFALIVVSCWRLFRRKRRRKPDNSIKMETFSELVHASVELPVAEKNTIQSPPIASNTSSSHSSSVSLSSDDSTLHNSRSRSKKLPLDRNHQKPKTEPIRSYINNPRTCLGVGIHIGILGILLAIIHLVVSYFHFTQMQFSSVLCLLMTSITTDTLYCVLFDLITCFLCLILIGYLSHPSSIRSKQHRFACLALSHSLPWALAAGFALFITLKPTNTSVQGSIFFTGYISVCLKVHQQSLHIQELILLVVIPLIGDFVVVIFFFCYCKRLPARVCLLSTLMPIINLTSFTPTLLKNLPNFVLLPLILNPIVICILYRFTMPRGDMRAPEGEVMVINKERSPLHQTFPNVSPSISSDVYFPQAILAITPHRCNHANGIPSIMPPKVCSHFQQIVAHSQNCTLERRSCNEIIQPAGKISALKFAPIKKMQLNIYWLK
ncbi:unnamed protein product [Rodentolepis nana]|uniref:G-protein coupled receptors family 1 profile domain-containing protein n=1 Tax=Rodentolepis nana TaxID=102285 RepID=A0A0R3TV05_RODNA|nr:unnamed protein product [Rodentolepis nana]